MDSIRSLELLAVLSRYCRCGYLVCYLIYYLSIFTYILGYDTFWLTVIIHLKTKHVLFISMLEVPILTIYAPYLQPEKNKLKKFPIYFLSRVSINSKTHIQNWSTKWQHYILYLNIAVQPNSYTARGEHVSAYGWRWHPTRRRALCTWL